MRSARATPTSSASRRGSRSPRPSIPSPPTARLRRATPGAPRRLRAIGRRRAASASPERFLEVEDGRRPHPADQGHAARGARTPDRCRSCAAELRASEKERAENVMIVDLMRNDLSRVCEPGSVGVDGLLEVESLRRSAPAGEHRRRARCMPGTTVGDLLDAAFPGREHDRGPEAVGDDDPARPRSADRAASSPDASAGSATTARVDLAMVIRSIVVHPRRRVRRRGRRHHVAIGCRGRGRRGGHQGARAARGARAPTLPPGW